MMNYHILTLRGFYKQGSLVTDQLDSSFSEDVAPVLIFPREKIEKNILIGLANYLRSKFDEDGPYPILSDIEDMKNGVYLPRDNWESECKEAICSITTLNELLSGTDLHIDNITFKLPPFYPYELARKQWDINEPDNLLCPLGIREYLKSFSEMKERLREVVKYAYNLGFVVSLENDQPTFFVLRSKQDEIPEDFFRKHNMKRVDPRTKETQFPWQIQSCPSNSNPKFVNLVLKGLECYRIGIMYDPEHWHMTFNYSRDHLIKNEFLTQEEKEFVESFGYLIKRGVPVLYERVLNPAEALSEIKFPVYGLHIMGYPSSNTSFTDEVDGKKVVKIAESFPLFFDSINMKRVVEFYADTHGRTLTPIDMSYAINDRNTREQIGREIYDNMRLVLSEAVKRPELHFLVIEMKSELGQYSGLRWQRFLATSKASLEYLLSES